MRRLIAFDCAGDTLLGSLDAAAGGTGLLIVSGGNEIRAGAHRGMASLAAAIAAQGAPVFRYDRRGVGDSAGVNLGYAAGRDDLLAAAAAFRAHAPQVRRLVGFGNCDAAVTLARHGRDAGIARVLLANPWVVIPPHGAPPPAAIRAHYAARLRDPATWRRALRGGISLTRSFNGLRHISFIPSRQSGFTAEMLTSIAAWGDEATILLAGRDATAIAYADAAARFGLRSRTVTIPTASHSFAHALDAAALEAAVRDLLNARE